MTQPLRLEGIGFVLFLLSGLLMISTFHRARVDGWILPTVWGLMLISIMARMAGLLMERRQRRLEHLDAQSLRR